MAASRKPSVYSYVDYRSFLGDSYAYAKATEYGFSFRVFSRRAGISSSNYLRLVIDGKRNLTAQMAARFAEACGLAGAQVEFFCELVAYNQAATNAERNRHHERLTRFRPFREIRQLESEHASYHSTWYLPAIRELCRRPDFVEDPAWIGAQLSPNVPVHEVKQALATLLKLGLLYHDDDGALRQRDALVATGQGPLGHHVFTYHHTMIERAGAALDQVHRDEREIASLTLCVSHDKMLELKQRLRDFRRDLLQLAELDNVPERVVQVNFQLFPLSNRADAPTAPLQAVDARPASRKSRTKRAAPSETDGKPASPESRTKRAATAEAVEVVPTQPTSGSKRAARVVGANDATIKPARKKTGRNR